MKKNNIKAIQDFSIGIENLHGIRKKMTLKEDGLMKVIFKNDSFFAFRFSGTEPKIKFYFQILSKK